MHADDAAKLRLTLFDKHDPILHQYFVRSYTYGVECLVPSVAEWIKSARFRR